MPHLSIETYVTQYFWLVLILFSFYYIAVTQIIPKFSETFKTRKKLENIGNESISKEENIASKRSTFIISGSISGNSALEKILISSTKFEKYQTHFSESNKR